MKSGDCTEQRDAPASAALRCTGGTTAPFYKLATLPGARAAAWEMKSGAAGSPAPNAPSRRPRLHRERFLPQAPGSRGRSALMGRPRPSPPTPWKRTCSGRHEASAQAGLGLRRVGRPEDGRGAAARAPGGAGPRTRGPNMAARLATQRAETADGERAAGRRQSPPRYFRY